MVRAELVEPRPARQCFIPSHRGRWTAKTDLGWEEKMDQEWQSHTLGQANSRLRVSLGVLRGHPDLATERRGTSGSKVPVLLHSL